MKPMSRVDIIVGKLKPTLGKERKDKMQSSDFVQEIDMDEDKMAEEAAAEAIIQAIKQSDAAALAEALKDWMACCKEDEMHEDMSEVDSE